MALQGYAYSCLEDANVGFSALRVLPQLIRFHSAGCHHPIEDSATTE